MNVIRIYVVRHVWEIIFITLSRITRYFVQIDCVLYWQSKIMVFL